MEPNHGHTPTTRRKIAQAWYPLGMRTVTLQTWGGLTCTSSCSYNVVGGGYTPTNGILGNTQNQQGEVFTDESGNGDAGGVY